MAWFFLLACFVLSGGAGLLYQTTWTQQFALVFGTSELALVTVLAAYMAGLALGAAAAGRLEHRVRRPLLVYALLELGVGAAALGVPFAVRAAGRLHVALAGGSDTLPDAASSGSALYYLASSFAILIVPTALMGATLPLLARHAVRTTAELGRRVGILYTANTAGAAAGTLVTAFVLLPRFELGTTLWIGAALNVLVAVLAVVLARGAAPVALSERRTVRKAFHWILPVVLLAGAVSFTYEVVWTRLLTFFFGGSVYAFAAMLATFLVGIALGAAVASPFATMPDRARQAFALAQAGVALSAVGALFAIDRVERPFVAALLILPLTVTVGATFPLAVRVLARDAGDAAPASARVLAWNTAGAILGALGAGYAVLPALAFAGTVKVAAVTSLVLAWIATVRPARKLRSVLAVGLLLLLAVPLPTPWRTLRRSSLGRSYEGEVAYYGVGRSATVLLFGQRSHWRLTTNGLPESSIDRPWSRASRADLARWMSLLPVALRPETRSLLVVGLGAGITVEEVPPTIEDIDVVELEPDVVRANRRMATQRRRDPLADPRVRIHVNDARSVLRLTRRRFDAIVSQPSHPWTAGSSHLFTREFFTLVRERLSDDGVFVQWMGLSFVDEALLGSLVATLADVFPHVEVYQPPGGGLLLVGSPAALDVAATVDAGLRAAPDEWAQVGVLCAEDVLVARVLDDGGARRFAQVAPVSTDGRNLLRMGSPRILKHPLGQGGADLALAPFDPLLASVPSLDALYVVRRLIRNRSLRRARRLAETLPDLAQHYTALGLTELAAGRYQDAEASFDRALALAPSFDEALFALLTLHRDAGVGGRASPLASMRWREDPVASAVVAGWGRGPSWKGTPRYEERLAGLDPRHPLFAEATRLRASWRVAQGDGEGAVRLLLPLLSPATPQDLLLLARAEAVAGRPLAALGAVAEALPRLRRPALRREARRLLESLRGDGVDEWRGELLQRLQGAVAAS